MHLTRHKLNSELIDWIKTHPYLENEDYYRTKRVAYRATPKRLHDRLSAQKIDELVTAFRTGVAKHILAEHHGINIKSVKKILRERGVKRKSRWDRAA